MLRTKVTGRVNANFLGSFNGSEGHSEQRATMSPEEPVSHRAPPSPRPVLSIRAATDAPGDQGKRRRDAKSTQQRILKVALALFTRKGFDGVRVKEIAKAAGVSVPLLCHHFRDKETLYQSVLDQALLRVASLGNNLLSQTGSISGRLEAALSGMLEILTTDSQEIAVLHREFMEGGARLRTKSKELLLPVKQTLIEEIRAAQTCGEVRADLDADFLLLHLVGAIIYPTIAAPILGILWGEATQASDWRSRRKQEFLAVLPLLLSPPSR